MEMKIHLIQGPIDPYLSLSIFNHGSGVSLGVRCFVQDGFYLTLEAFYENLQSKLPQLSVFPLSKASASRQLVINNGWRFGMGQGVELFPTGNKRRGPEGERKRQRMSGNLSEKIRTM